MVRCVEKGFELSEASNTPVMLELRIRACHVCGSFVAKDNVAAAHSTQRLACAPAALQLRPAGASAGDLPPGEPTRSTGACRRRASSSSSRQLNELLGPADGDLGIIVQGGLSNVLNGRLALAGPQRRRRRG